MRSIHRPEYKKLNLRQEPLSTENTAYKAFLLYNYVVCPYLTGTNRRLSFS